MQMLDHQDADGRFQSYASERSSEPPVWGALLCDSHAPTWYGAYAFLDTLGRYPALWRGERIDPADRTAVAELAACLVRYNLSRDGTVTPRSAFQGFASSSFGQKKTPSGFATARALAVLHRLDDLAGAAAAVDVSALSSSKGGTGTARPPATSR